MQYRTGNLRQAQVPGRASSVCVSVSQRRVKASKRHFLKPGVAVGWGPGDATWNERGDGGEAEEGSGCRLHQCRQCLEDLVGGDFFRFAGLTYFEFNLPLCQALFPDDQVEGGTDQVGIVKFDPGAFVTVVPEDFGAGLL